MTSTDMPKEIPKTYEPQKVEDALYKQWEASGIFQPDKKAQGEPFSIAMPPFNVTGTLHIGHAVLTALQDIMIRFARMNGRPTLWLPGTDHASIATENKVEKLLFEKSKTTKQELGREKFIKEVEKFAASSQHIIKNQVRKMGTSCDWSRERYTLDAGLSRCVQEVFVKMYNDGLIYRGHRIVNWCTRCQSTLADDEVEYKEQYGKFYYLKYGPVTIGTARPETKVLDKVIIVHPDDKRYKKYVGKTLDVLWIDGTIKATFVADKATDMKMGSGAMTITPAHSFVDFGLAQKYSFEIKQIIGPDGKLTKNGGQFAGMPVGEAREAIVAELKKKGLVEKIDENYVHNLSVCYRCDTPVEPLVSDQWFVNVDKKISFETQGIASLQKKNNEPVKMSLKEMAIHVVKSGDIKILPDRFNKTYFQWMENLHDWCISRQIWFGHRIPVWYDKNDRTKFTVAVKSPGKNYEQDPDTLDTWFSSALWTFSTLLDKPQPNETLDSWIKRNKQPGKDLQMFHPTSVLETAYDILFFWVARMILMTTYIMGEIPFKIVYLHGLVRDKQGRKMSKSLDNGIDPLDMVNQYGADATRLSLVIGTTPGNDTRLYEEKIAGYRNFVNKIWNIARFILMNDATTRHPERSARLAVAPAKRVLAESRDLKGYPRDPSTRPAGLGRDDDSLADQWIQSRLQKLIHDVTDHFEKYEFSPAGEKIYDFLWHELADWYVEISKTQDHTLAPEILFETIKLLHPFTPFVTEHIFQLLKESGLIKSKDKFLAISAWPSVQTPHWGVSEDARKKIQSDFAVIQELVTALRDLRASHNLPYSEKLDAAITTKNYKDLFQEQELIIEALTKVRIQVLPTKPVNQEDYIRGHKTGFDVYLKLSKQVSAQQEKRLAQERANLEKYIKSLQIKLANKNFLKNAPKEVVEKEKVKLKEAQARLARHSELVSESSQ